MQYDFTQSTLVKYSQKLNKFGEAVATLTIEIESGDPGRDFASLLDMQGSRIKLTLEPLGLLKDQA